MMVLASRAAAVAPDLPSAQGLRSTTLVIWALVAVGVVSYFNWPLHGDASTHLTGIHQALVTGRGLQEAWNFRGPVYNVYLFCLYWGASLVSPFSEVTQFDKTLKVLHLLVVAASSTLAATGLAGRVRSLNGLAAPLTGLFLLAYLASTWTFWLHAEDVGFVLLLLSVGLATRKPPVALVLAGLVASCLPMLKVVTAALCLPAFLSVLVDRTHVWRAVGLFGAAFVTSVGMQAYLFSSVWTLPVQDLIEAGLFQNSANATWSQRMLRFRLEWPGFLEGTAMFAAALGLLSAVLAQSVATRRLREAALLLGSWLAPALMVLVQHKYFAYHFGCMAFGAALTVAYALARPAWSRASAVAASLAFLVLLEETDHPYFFDHPVSRLAVLGCAGAVALATWLPQLPRLGSSGGFIPSAAMLALVLSWFPSDDGLSFSRGKDLITRTARKVTYVRSTEQKRGLTGQTVLLLTYGTTARLLDVKSACRHYFPIPFQRFRIEDRRAFESSAGFVENRDCILGYLGKHVILQEKWMRRSDLFPELKANLVRHYRRVAWLGAGHQTGVWERRTDPPRKAKAKRTRKSKGKDKAKPRRKLVGAVDSPPPTRHSTAIL